MNLQVIRINKEFKYGHWNQGQCVNVNYISITSNKETENEI